MALAHRPASPADYPLFTRLFPELATGDPLPSPARWAAEIAPDTWLFEQDGADVGYLFFERLGGVGYVRHVVVAPERRGHGLGAAMLRAAAAELRAAGCQRWCLNVKPDNLAAIRLYQRLGMRPAYSSVALRFQWSQVERLPPSHVHLKTCPIAADEDAAVEDSFAVPRGQLAGARGGRVLLRLADPADPTALGLGFACFNPDFPGAFPFRVQTPGHARPLLTGLRPHARPDLPNMALVAEDDPGLVAALRGVGAAVHLEIVHYSGPVP